MTEPARNPEHPVRIERLLETALAPIEPPAGFVDELEAKLTDVQAAAREALEVLADFDLTAMRDPRNWVRPAVAVVAGTAAGTALVLLQVRRGRRQRAGGLKGLAEQGGKDLLDAVEWTRGRLR
jgi:hypothetical protein